MSILRNCPPGLAAFLGSEPTPFVNADLYTVTLLDGSKFYWTSSDAAIMSDGNLFSNLGPTLSRSRWGLRNTVEVPQLDIKLRCGNDKTIDGIPIKRAIHDGVFDGARWQLDRAYLPAPAEGVRKLPIVPTLGIVLLFEGRQAKAMVHGLGADITVKPDAILFNQYMPRNLFQEGCVWTLYSAGCGVAKLDFTFPFTVGFTPDPTSVFIPWAGTPSPFTPFGLGQVEFVSGPAEGQRRTVEAVDATGLTLTYPLYDVPAPGDSFNASYGCKKTEDDCTNSFANLRNMLGFRFTPVPETAL